MTPQIRPLPAEAASQRTEIGAVKSETNENPQGFAALLDSQVEPEKESRPQTVEPDKPKDAPPEPWMVIGFAPVVAPVPQPILVEASTPGLTADLPETGTPAVTPASDPPEEAPEQPASVKLQTNAAAEQKLPAPFAPEVAEFAEKPAPKEAESGGIPVAKQPPMPFTTEKSAAPRSPEPQKAFLLEAAAVPADPAPLVELRRPWVKFSEAPRVQRVEAAFSESNFVLEPRVELSPAREVQPVMPARPVALIEAIQQQVQIIRATPERELQVVLRPDAQTELFIHVRKEDGQLHLHARCERGDFRYLDSQWTAIQSSLSAQGVRVEPLQSAARVDINAGFSSLGDERGSRRDTPQQNDLSFEQETTLKKNSPRASFRGRGWQSWA